MAGRQLYREICKTVGQMRYPGLRIGQDAEAIRERHAYVCVRDALYERGVRFRVAEKLAKETKGPVVQRFFACLEELENRKP